MSRFVQLRPEDNLVLAVDPFEQGSLIADVRVRDPIPAGHKMALVDMAPGQLVMKYGFPIGCAKVSIGKGQWLHDHNVHVPPAGAREVSLPRPHHIDLPPNAASATFQGFRRADGRFGTRNYLAVMTSVNCSATVARRIADAIERSGVLADYPQIDGILALTHGSGCGLAAAGLGYRVLQRTLTGYLRHPNIGGALIVGLGCETLQVASWFAESGLRETPTLRALQIQDVGGTAKTVAAGVAAVHDMLPQVGAARRTVAPAAELTLALQCGGSDGYSGLTANPALGVAVDHLVAAGGTAILSETPEIYGAEHLLLARACDREVARKLQGLLDWWADHAAKNHMNMNNNPSPGNKAGGLTTILEKSLGAVAKSGSTPLLGVFDYAEPLSERGLVFMDSPGYDPVSATGQVASGANLMCFTTGRGSAFGCKPTPSLKLASNSPMFEKMVEDMDLNCGDILDGVSHADKGQEIFDLILATASGQVTKSEAFGYGDNEFVPWSLGATL